MDASKGRASGEGIRVVPDRGTKPPAGKVQPVQARNGRNPRKYGILLR